MAGEDGAADGRAPQYKTNDAKRRSAGSAGGGPPRYAAIDLGTNNCRLLVAAPRSAGRGGALRVVDAFSRIVRLGEGLARNGALSDAAMARAIEALKICADKMDRRGVTRRRCIATQACRAAANGEEFLAAVERETGLRFEIISTAEEASLAVRGCADLLDQTADRAIVFDIGGGSTELSLVRPNGAKRPKLDAWLSMPVGVVKLSETCGGRDLSADTYERVVADVGQRLRDLAAASGFPLDPPSTSSHLLGTSGTVTSIAGVHLGLDRYRRDAVDGLWLTADDARDVSGRLRDMSWDERAREPCIGAERADLVVCGCAILEALLRAWPATRIRVGDRGLREGVLAGRAEADRRRTRRRGHRRSGRRKRAAAPSGDASALLDAS
ncbi:MAG: Ppx/GppA phosphatase family protein [Parvularculaceae bacterium]